jgi:hypothetical protein
MVWEGNMSSYEEEEWEIGMFRCIGYGGEGEGIEGIYSWLNEEGGWMEEV